MTAANEGQPDRTPPAPQPESLAGPILRETKWDGKLPRARAHVAMVLVYRRGEYQVIWPHERTRVLLHRRPATVYEVDLGIHHAKVKADLPSQDHTGSFHAIIGIHWRVLDPSAVVRHQILDMEEALGADLLHLARGIAINLSIDQVAAAEEKINERFQGVEIDISTPAGMQQTLEKAIKAESLGAKYGLWTSATITNMTLDKAATEHNIKMIKLRWALEEEKAEQELRIAKNKNEQEIMADNIAVYRDIIAVGDVERFALRLARHPDEISAVTEIIREDQLTRRHDTIDFIKHMVDSGVVERWEVSDQVREALEWLKDATARVVTDKNHRTADIDQPVRQRRRGRGEPIEQTAAAELPSDVIVMSAETIPAESESDAKSASGDDG